MKTSAQLLDLLGREATDRITGFKGVVASISFDLYGCVQVVLTPKVKDDGTLPEGKWFDTNRLVEVSEAKMMEFPASAPFKDGEPLISEASGPADKPGKPGIRSI